MTVQTSLQQKRWTFHRPFKNKLMKERKYSSNVTINKKSWRETGNISDYYTDAPSHFPVNQRRRVLHKFPGSTPERRSTAPTARRASALKCLWFLHLKAINYVCVFFRCQQDKSINYEILVNLLSLVAFYLTSHAFSCNSIYNNSANKKKVENYKVVALQ